MTKISSDERAVCDELQQLISAPLQYALDAVESAKRWLEDIQRERAFLDDRAHSIVFVGGVGVGKSSLIGVVANLLVGPAPKDRKSLKDNSVLAIGSGRTTVCEVHIRAANSNDKKGLGLTVDPFSFEEMKKEVETFAEDEWRRRQSEALPIGEDDCDPIPQEIQRVIREMTGCAEYRETYEENRIKRSRIVRPLDEVVSRYKTHDELARYLVERANLSERTTTEWWWDSLTIENLRKLKIQFGTVNMGNNPNAMLPHSITVVVPDSLPGSRAELDLMLFDSRGLDGAVETRGDLQKYLQNERTVIVLCIPFNDAPGDTMRNLLRFMDGDAQLRQAIPRIVLLLLDKGDSDQVNGSEGDREYGQTLKIEECFTALEGMTLHKIDAKQVFAFDVLQDNRLNLVATIDDHLLRLRQRVQDQLSQLVKGARVFLDNVFSDQNRLDTCNRVDQHLREAMQAYLPFDAPLSDPLAGLYNAIRGSRYASVVYATCRRRGTYHNLDLYIAVKAEARRAATAWLENLFGAVYEKLDSLEEESALCRVLDHISLRKRQYQKAQIDVNDSYATKVYEEVEKLLIPDDPVWSSCLREWGVGRGFKDRVLDHLTEWSRKQQGLVAHETTDAERIVPFLSEMVRQSQPQPPSFMLHVRNIRALRQVNWTPESLSLIIGANGVGKTTLLLIFRFLRVAYERGLSDAVTNVFGGVGNLRSWGISEEEPMELGLDIGDVSWRIQLMLHNGTVDNLAKEHLSDGGRKIFFRDSLGDLSYNGNRIESRSKLGLRALMDRGVHEPSLRSIALFLHRISVFYDPDLWSVRQYGSNTADDHFLNRRGTNALAVLRRWYQDRTNQHRYKFVIEGLNAAFPNTVESLDFVEAGNTLTVRIYRPNMESPNPLAHEANGVLQLLILLCSVASAEDESVVAIDEPENSLHPYAIRAFLRRTKRWAKQHNLTILLATHSTVLLDELTGAPEQVYVMQVKSGDPIPTQLDVLCNREWLEAFKLGDLYEQGEIGSNEDDL